MMSSCFAPLLVAGRDEGLGEVLVNDIMRTAGRLKSTSIVSGLTLFGWGWGMGIEADRRCDSGVMLAAIGRLSQA